MSSLDIYTLRVSILIYTLWFPSRGRISGVPARRGVALPVRHVPVQLHGPGAPPIGGTAGRALRRHEEEVAAGAAL